MNGLGRAKKAKRGKWGRYCRQGRVREGLRSQLDDLDRRLYNGGMQKWREQGAAISYWRKAAFKMTKEPLVDEEFTIRPPTS